MLSIVTSYQCFCFYYPCKKLLLKIYVYVFYMFNFSIAAACILYHSLGLFSKWQIDFIFSSFCQITGFDISCKLSPLATICMKCQLCFLGEISAENFTQRAKHYTKAKCMPVCLLTLVLLNPDILFFCKQCRSRSVGFFRSQLIRICTVCH